MIQGVPPAQFDDLWPRVRPFFENFASREYDATAPEEYAEDVKAARRQLWVVNDFQAVCLTYLSSDCVWITHCAGLRRHEWQNEVVDHLQDWARALGKRKVVAQARPGWSKLLRTRGYKEAHREMVLNVQ